MKGRKTLVVVAVVAALSFGAMMPQQARAIDTTEVLIWTGVGVAAIALVAIVATLLTRDEDRLFMTEPPLDAEDPLGARSHVRLGMQCAPTGGRVPLVCW